MDIFTILTIIYSCVLHVVWMHSDTRRSMTSASYRERDIYIGIFLIKVFVKDIYKLYFIVFIISIRWSQDNAVWLRLDTIWSQDNAVWLRVDTIWSQDNDVWLRVLM